MIFKIIDWKLPVVYIAASAVAALVFYKNGWLFILPTLLSGGLLFAAVYMLTDYSTSPNTTIGRIIFAAGAGFPYRIVPPLQPEWLEGVSFAIVLMNLTVPLLDRIIPKPFGYVKPKRRRPVVKKPADKKPTDFKKRQKAFFKSESFKAVAVLAIIALVTSLILSVVYRFTAIDEAEAMRKKINDVYNAGTITPIDVSGYDNKADSVILNAFMAEDGACVVVSKTKKACNAAQGITLFVIIKDGRIAKVANYSSSETPGLGSKALEGAYLEQ